MLGILIKQGLNFLLFDLFKEMIISRWIDDVRDRFTSRHFGLDIWSKRCGDMSFHVAIQSTFSGSCVITLGTRKHV